MADKSKGSVFKGLLDELPVDRLKEEIQSGLSTLGSKAIENAGSRLTGMTEKLNDTADGGGFVKKAAAKGAEEAAEGGSPVKGALKGGVGGLKDKVKEKLPGGGGGGGGGKRTKATNIIEEIDVGVPVHVAYNQWTQFQEFSGFMKKVDHADEIEDVEEGDEVEVTFKAQVFWSHRSWEAKILEQVPDEKIVWRSKGDKGHVDGAVTFHELAPNLTRILVVLEYYPQGLFERTGNLWRAQGRRARLELKHFRRHVMTEVIQNPDEVEGWRGVIADGEVQQSHDDFVEEEEQQDEDEQGEDGQSQDEEEYEAEDAYDDAEEPVDDEAEAEEDVEPEDEYEDEDEPVDEAEEGDGGDEEAVDEYEEGEEEEEEPLEDADEYEEDAEEYEEPEDVEEEEEPEEEEEKPRRRRRAG